MEYELNININPELDVNKLNSTLKSIENTVKNFPATNPFNTETLQKSLNAVPQLIADAGSKIKPFEIPVNADIENFWTEIENFDTNANGGKVIAKFSERFDNVPDGEGYDPYKDWERLNDEDEKQMQKELNTLQKKLDAKLLTTKQYATEVEKVYRFYDDAIKAEEENFDTSPANNKKINTIQRKTQNQINDAMAGMEDEFSPEAIEVKRQLELQREVDFYDLKALNYDQFRQRIVEINKKYDNMLTASQDKAGNTESVKVIKDIINSSKEVPNSEEISNDAPMKMMLSDRELEAYWLEFEGANKEYRDQELEQNQKMLDDKLISEELFLENKLRINSDYNTRLHEVQKFTDTADSITDETTVESKDEEKATKKPEKVFDAFEKLIKDRSHTLQTAARNLTANIADTLGALFDSDEDKLKTSANKVLKTLGELIKKVASAAITNIVVGQLGITGATTGIGAIISAPAILGLVQGVVGAIIDPIVEGLSMKTGGKAESPTSVVIGDNPYSPEWVLRDFDIQAIIEKALQKALITTKSETDKSVEIQNELIEIIKTEERYSQANNFFNTGEPLQLQKPISQNVLLDENHDYQKVISQLEKLNNQFSQFEGRIHIVESEVAQAANNYNNSLKRRTTI